MAKFVSDLGVFVIVRALPQNYPFPNLNVE